jgi:hypothetical protein
MKIAVSKILSTINRLVIFVTFRCKAGKHCILEADYFRYTVLIKLTPMMLKKDCFLYTVKISNEIDGTDVVILKSDLKSNTLKNALHKIIEITNMFIESHPFSIERHGFGKYTLLDPDGYDYIGEYVTKRDAIKTCDSNFKYENPAK